VDTPPAPPIDFVQYGRKDSNTRRRVQDSRNSKPEQVHIDFHLKGGTAQYTVMQITKRTDPACAQDNRMKESC
jgi:hypothetical protein